MWKKSAGAAPDRINKSGHHAGFKPTWFDETGRLDWIASTVIMFHETVPFFRMNVKEVSLQRSEFDQANFVLLNFFDKLKADWLSAVRSWMNQASTDEDKFRRGTIYARFAEHVDKEIERAFASWKEGRLSQLEASQSETPTTGKGDNSDGHRRGLNLASPERYVFRLDGKVWRVAYKQGKEFFIPDLKGMRYLHYLLQSPNKEIHVLDLVGTFRTESARGIIQKPSRMSKNESEEEGLSESDLGDAGEFIDEKAKLNYKQRLQQIEEELEDAKASLDSERQETLEDEKDALIDQLEAGFDRKGRARRVGATDERARISVTNSIRDAIKRIQKVDVSLSRHFQQAIRTGVYCEYTPETPLSWEL